MRNRMKLTWILSPLAIALLGSIGVRAQTPLEDIGFSPATPLPDPDMVIVREKAYGAGGIDLTQYGIGTGPVDHVQSIYFRFFVDNNASQHKSALGRVLFPPEITILGVITDGQDLGGASDDGLWTGTDLVFGIGADPDAYSEEERGFESGGNNDEFVCIPSPQSLVFGLHVSNGVDDFRVIIDYGDSFPDGLTFDVGAYDLPVFGGVVPNLGFLVGDDANPSVPGSGNFGEAGSLLGIPLTTVTSPLIGCDFPLSPENSVYVLRDTSTTTWIDGFDAHLRIPGPGLFSLSSGILGDPDALTSGPDGRLYAIGAGNGYGVIDVHNGVVNEALISDLGGSNVDLTGLPGSRDLYFVRDTTGDTMVDRFDVDMLTFLQSFPVPAAQVGTPVGITDGADGLLYVVGSTTGFVSVDPVTGAVSNIGLSPPSGSNVDITGRAGASMLYVLRDTSGDSKIDAYDFVSGVTTYDFAATSAIGAPAGLTNGPDDRLYMIGKGEGSSPAGLAIFDADTGLELESNICMDLLGSNADIAYTIPGPQGFYCTSKMNSAGCTAKIGFSGEPSATSPFPFEITAAEVINNKNGVLFYGYAPSNLPFLGGYLCVEQPIRHFGIHNSGGDPPPNNCSGSFSVDFNAFIQSGKDPALLPCISIYCQWWYRDKFDPTGHTVGLSDALEFEIGI